MRPQPLAAFTSNHLTLHAPPLQMENHHSHILLVTFPAQGHINPSLQFASRLIKLDIQVTFVTSVSAYRKMSKTNGTLPPSLNFTPFSDGHDDGYKRTDDQQCFMSELRLRGSQCLKDIISESNRTGCPVTCVVYTLLLPWVAEVARELHVPSALLWIQPAAVFDIYYYYFHGYSDVFATNCSKDDYPSCFINLPGLPPLKSSDLPSFLLPSSKNVYDFALPLFKKQMEILDEEEKPMVLVNTFDALENEALKCLDEKISMIAVGPLIPSASDDTFRVDLFQKSRSYIDWLDLKPEASVVYVSFGSILELEKKQMEEIARGLLRSGRPFLWVIREKNKEDGSEEEEKLSCMEELEKNGMIVPWCSQLEVLSHPSLGCFVTHCGWNSTLESLVYGVPLVAFPQWTDQGTNAKLIEDVWRNGVRVKAANADGFVESEEIGRCIEMVMGGGERGKEIRTNAKKWKDLGREAMKEGGSSDNNLKSFVDEIGRFSLDRN